MKIYACVLVAASIIVYGIYDYLKFKKNTLAIGEILSFIGVVANEIHYKNSSYPDLILSGKNQGYRFICFSEENISVNCDIENIKNDFAHFTQCLGTTDIQGQLSLCNEYIEKFRCNFDKRKVKEESSLQINLSLSILCALSVVVLFV